MPLPDNQFFEVEWREAMREGQPIDRKGVVLEWGAPYGATAITIIMRDDMKVVKVNTNQLTVRGLIDIAQQPATPKTLPLRQITLRR